MNQEVDVVQLPAICCLLSWAFLFHVTGQQTGTGSGTKAPVSPAPRSTGGFGGATRSTPRPGEGYGMSMELAFSGRVLLETKKPAPEPVAVNITCHGETFGDWTDAKGRFAIPLGRTYAGAGNLSGNVNVLSGCRAEIGIAGYERYVRQLGKSRGAQDLDAGDIVLKPVAAGAAASFSALTVSAPESARREYTRALEAAGSREFAKAVDHLDKAVRQFPSFAAALFLKGVVLERLGQREQARAAYTQSAAADPAYLKPLVQLAEMYAEEQEPAPAAEWSHRANVAAPRLSPAMYLIEGGAYLNLDRLEEAEKAARDGLSADSSRSHPRLHKLLGEVLFRQHRYTPAADQFNLYLAAAPGAPDMEQAKEMSERCAKLAKILGR